MENENRIESVTECGECLNCGTELIGNYCHECGQMKDRGDSSVLGFILEYLNNAYMWDTQIMVTSWQLFTKPGYLTRRFLSGKYVSHSHPLKLNMFMLFVFFTLFFIFHQDEKINDSIHNFTRKGLFFSSMQINHLIEDEEYAEKLKNSPLDTVMFHGPIGLAEEFGDIFTVLEVHEDDGNSAIESWTAVIPRVLIEDEIITRCCGHDFYHFNSEADTDIPAFKMIDDISSRIVSFFSNYFLLIVLITVPALAFCIKIAHYRAKAPLLNHLIFTLHYTALIEGVILLLYVLHLIANPSAQIMKWLIIISTNVYLTIAYRQVYNNSWIKSAVKSLMTNAVYSLILVIIFFIVFIVACMLTISNM